MTVHLSLEELLAGLDVVRSSPADRGNLELIVRRPEPNCREELEEGSLDLVEGLVGDCWSRRPNKRRPPDFSPDPDMQINMMNANAALLVAAGDAARRALCGDQLYVDFDLSVSNLPPLTRVAVGDTAVIEITAVPHRGCSKFTERFGADAVRFVNSSEGRELRVRGVNAKVVVPGPIRRGDAVRKLPA